VVQPGGIIYPEGGVLWHQQSLVTHWSCIIISLGFGLRWWRRILSSMPCGVVSGAVSPLGGGVVLWGGAEAALVRC